MKAWTIRAINDEGKESYIGYDRDAGFYMSPLAEKGYFDYIFNTRGEADNIMNRIMSGKVLTYTDGITRPNVMQWAAIGLNNIKTSGWARFELCEIELNPVEINKVFWPRKPDPNENWYLTNS